MSRVSSASLKKVGLPPTSKQNLFIDFGVGEEASGYIFGSSSCKWCGAFIIKGGKLVVVVVVVVTIVVCVAGAKENWPNMSSADESSS